MVSSRSFFSRSLSSVCLDQHLRNLGLQCLESFCELLDGHGEVVYGLLKVLLLTFLVLCLPEVFVERTTAEVLELDLVSLLLQQLCNHVVNGFLNFCEGV